MNLETISIIEDKNTLEKRKIVARSLHIDDKQLASSMC